MLLRDLAGRLLLAFSFVLIGSPMLATHLAGAEIQYRYIGDSTGIARHYEVTLKIYRDASGVQLLPTTDVAVVSSCFAQQTVSMTRSLPPDQIDFGDGGYETPGFNDCVSEAMANRGVFNKVCLIA